MAQREIATGLQAEPIGNRLALVGAVVYLLEWVAIVAASPPGPFGPGATSADILDAYSGHDGAAALSAGWFAVCLVGRVIYMAGLKASLRARPVALALMDVAVAAMAISVALEVVPTQPRRAPLASPPTGETAASSSRWMASPSGST